MSDSDFDWTFDSIPAEDSAEPGSPTRPPPPKARRAPPRPPATPIPARPQPRPLGRRWQLAGLLLAPVVVLGLIVYAVYAVGWQRVRAQLAREVAYEDEQSQAGNVNAVMALHAWGNEAWQRRRTAEVAAGLAAPRPAADLTPLAEPPQVVAVDTFGERLFTSTVVRQYADSAGEVYRFRFTQRYFNNGPGLWQRLPPDEARLAAAAVWTGRRMSVTYPVADAAWMTSALPQIDAYLIEACAVWACPTELTLPVVFSGQLDEMPRPAPVQPAVTPPGGYPMIFDTAIRAPRYPQRVILPSPQLAGVPHDEAASQALVRAITADLLGQLAGEVAGANRAQYFYFLDALVARAEVRLGLSAAPPPQPLLAEYLSVTELWRGNRGNAGGVRPPMVAPRLQALWFLNDVLGDRLPTADASLLASVREAPGLADWLATAAQVDGPAAIAGWEAGVTSRLAASAPADWRQLDGLGYTCAGGGWLVEAGGPRPLPQEIGQFWMGPLTVSPNGAHMAAVAVVSDTNQLRLVNLDDRTMTVIVAHAAYPLGWAVTGELVVVDQAASTAGGRLVNRLRVYEVDTGALTPVTGMEVVTRDGGPAWSANRQALAITLTDGAVSADARTLPAIVAFDESFTLLLTAWQGRSPTLSPDGRWLAYITQQTDGALGTPAEARVKILDLENGTLSTALALADLPADQPFDQLSALSWSPDGSRLALVGGQGNSDHLFMLILQPDSPGQLESVSEVTLPATNFRLVGFSSDGEYLAIEDTAVSANRLMVLDLAAPAAPVFEANAGLAAWSSTGHRLALANSAGLYVADPLTGETQWVAAGDCTPSWHSAN